MEDSNPNIDLINLIHLQTLVKFCPFVLKILSKNKFDCQLRAITLLKICERLQVKIPLTRILSI